jgi:hypothetical protein
MSRTTLSLYLEVQDLLSTTGIVTAVPFRMLLLVCGSGSGVGFDIPLSWRSSLHTASPELIVTTSRVLTVGGVVNESYDTVFSQDHP